MYQNLNENLVGLQKTTNDMIKNLDIAIHTGNKASMRRFRSLSHKVTKSLKEFRQETIRIEKETKK